MKTLYKLLLCLSVVGLLSIWSCKDDDDDPQGCDYATETLDELNAVNAAATTYGNNPTPANCQALKDAYGAYLDELEDHVECAALSGQQAEIQASIDQAQASLDTIC
jgi:hypothetical protein